MVYKIIFPQSETLTPLPPPPLSQNETRTWENLTIKLLSKFRIALLANLRGFDSKKMRTKRVMNLVCSMTFFPSRLLIFLRLISIAHILCNHLSSYRHVFYFVLPFHAVFVLSSALTPLHLASSFESLWFCFSLIFSYLFLPCFDLEMNPLYSVSRYLVHTLSTSTSRPHKNFSIFYGCSPMIFAGPLNLRDTQNH